MKRNQHSAGAQLNFFRAAQQYGRGRELTKGQKLARIDDFVSIRRRGGTLRDVAIKWQMSPNSAHSVEWKVRDYKKELGLK
jgi:hypothetical protein